MKHQIAIIGIILCVVSMSGLIVEQYYPYTLGYTMPLILVGLPMACLGWDEEK